MDKILVVLFELGFALKFNLVGSISVSELFLVAYFVSLAFKKKKLLKIQEYKRVVLLYVGLLVAQILSEIVVGNDLSNAMKGISVTIVSFLHFTFLCRLFLKDRSLVVWILIGMVLQTFLFPSFTGEMSEALEGEDAKYLKFVVAPALYSLLLAISCLRHRFSMPYVFMFVGLFFIVAGARSGGGTVLLTGVIAWFFMRKKALTLKTFYTYSAVILLVSYSMYVVYVNNVLSGKISSGNTEQLFRAENPYNPINLLMVGRSETFVGWVAFMDKPIFGHGAWAKDVGLKYHMLQSQISGGKYNVANILTDVIPTHSVLIGTGTMNGVFAFLFMLGILVVFFKRGVRLMISGSDRYTFIIIGFCIMLLWTALFSPLSHFRFTLPLYFAFIFVSYIQIKKNKIENKTHENLLCDNG